jgi:hypothetical protein
MTDHKIPMAARLKIAILLIFFAFALWASSHLWHTGARAIASTPLVAFSALSIIYVALQKTRNLNDR